MGKIRVKMLGDQTLEQEQKKEARITREAKQAKKRKEVKGEELPATASTEASETQKLSVTEEPVPSVVAKKQRTKKARSKKYQTIAKMIDKSKHYSLAEALPLLQKVHLAGFDETVELHINTVEAGVWGTITLPHGTGKKVKIAIANPSDDQKAFDELVRKIESGNIDFDVLIATPDAMPKLAKVARILGPRGLMPNPKNGTLTPKPENLAKQYEDGQLRFKTEAKFPIIHMIVGKLSFGEKKLLENIQTALSGIPDDKIKHVTLKSTMSPGIKIDMQSLS